MKLTVLTDNTSGKHYYAEHGLSYLIDHEGKKYLFDTGQSDVFQRNAMLLNVDIDQEIQSVILSHGHWDHGNGLPFVKYKRLICHPAIFTKRYRIEDKRYIGLRQSQMEIMSSFEVTATREPVELANGMFFLGEIPRTNNFEAQRTTFINENGEPDYVLDDSAVAVVTNDGIVVVTGCSHAGVCNIIAHARNVTGCKKVRSVIGGLHLKKRDSQFQQTLAYFNAINIGCIYPSHCTDFSAVCDFKKEFRVHEVQTGISVNFD